MSSHDGVVMSDAIKPTAAAAGLLMSSLAAPTTTLLRSMRASSPTRRSSGDDYYNDHWRIRYPSALGVFGDIIKASRGKQIVMFLDYDGTLSPIVEDPDKAFMTDQMRKAVSDVAKHLPTAIVTGRCISKVFEFVQLSELYYAGSHGMDIKGPEKGRHAYKKANNSLLYQPANEYLPMIDEVHNALLEKTKSIDGAKVENNKFCLSVHYRCVEEKKWINVVEQVKSVLIKFPKLRMCQGRKVLEIRPSIEWNKGNALEFLLGSLGYGNSDNVFPVYIGDDRTDEDAFKVLQNRRRGLGIIVSKTPTESNASYSLEDPLQVMQFLRLMVEIYESN
ncbi:unnamed protein product [Cuscuta epithymum]|uniref:Trehalose 6-phosphate phosphatase n=1 Tax=Cuscuta epithymum TaxID=186058 RepID=A0AAV0DL65_9ASTE|nr:unnamed protein product [Cuscuta epithymum]CAH9121273.1 unnamed protein product [Cuscuta epithymum]